MPVANFKAAPASLAAVLCCPTQCVSTCLTDFLLCQMLPTVELQVFSYIEKSYGTACLSAGSLGNKIRIIRLFLSTGKTIAIRNISASIFYYC